VDYDLLAGTERLVAAQVKSRGFGRSMSGPEAFAILRRLINSGPAGSYELITNAQPADSLLQLMHALAEAPTSIELHTRLLVVLRSSPTQSQALSHMSEREIDALRFARVVVDDRPAELLRREVGQLLKAHRRRKHGGIGPDSSGVLTGYLLSEVMRRAADVDSSAWLLEDLRQQAELHDSALLETLGYRDWGAILGSLPPLPDIRRTALMQEMQDQLVRSEGKADGIRRMRLTGLSGVGKSSLACGFVGENADRYDMVMWLDASSQEALDSSFRRVLEYLRQRRGAHGLRQPQLAPGEVAAEVSWLLAELDMAWLAVFDDADDPRSLEAYIPKIGNGTVIITSVNAAGRYDEQFTLEVPCMTPAEAMALTAQRLSIEQPHDREELKPLEQPGAELAYWPLAIELAAGYILGCGLPLAEIPRYVTLVKSRALDDQLSVPAGYPRTVVAAVQLGLDRVEESVAMDRSLRGSLRSLVDIALAALGYLAPRQVPVHLLVSRV
jgi:hypothetical protein